MPKIDTTNLTEADKTALSKLSRGSLPVGHHSVDALYHVVADFDKSEDYERNATVAIPLKKALALFVQYCGITRHAALTKLTEAMKDALDSKTEVDLAVIEEAENLVTKAIGALPKLPCSGPITFHALKVTRLPDTQIEKGNV